MNQIRANAVTNQSTQFSVLSESQCSEIFQAAQRVLERTGCDVANARALQILKDAGCRVEGTHVWIPPYLVEKSLRSVQKQITIYDAEGNPHMHLSARNGKSYWAPGIGSLRIIDRHTDENRKCVYKDAYEVGLVIDALPNIDLAVCLCNVSDCNPLVAELYELRALLETTTKPITLWHANKDILLAHLEMFAAVAGGMDKFVAKPFGIVNCEPVSPLAHTDEVLEKALYNWELGIPSSYAATTMMGASAPVTMAGSFVLGLADTLVGLVLSQEVNPGCPFIASAITTPFDMRVMNPALTGPEVFLGASGNADLFRYLDLPFFVSLGGTDSPIFDQQAACDMALTILAGTLSGCCYSYFSGYIETGMSCSVESLVYIDEVIEMSRRYIGGIEVNEETLALTL